jgi:hypothetical protein
VSDELHRALSELADDVCAVDLRERALAQSHRIARRVRVLTVATVLTAAAAVTIGIAAVWPAGLGGPPPPAGSVTASPSRDPSAPVLGGWTSTPRASLPGEAVFLSFEPRDDGRFRMSVNRLIDGQLSTAHFLPELGASDCLIGLPSLSPDGSMVVSAVDVTDAGGNVLGAALYVTELDTRQSRRLLDDVGCGSTTWAPDSSRVLASTRDGCRWVAVATGAVSPFEGIDRCGYVAFAQADGVWAQFPDVHTADDSVIATLPAELPGVPEATKVEVQAVSADGRFVVMGTNSGDTTHSREGSWVWDTGAAEFLSIADLLGRGHDQESLTNVVFLPGQAMVVSTVAADESPIWHLVSRAGLVKATLADAPDRIRTGQFAYR